MLSPLSQTDPGVFKFHWLNLVAPVRKPSVYVAVGDIRRPTIFNGFFLVASNAGWTHAREPNWPEVEAASVTDGTVVWDMTEAASLVTITSQTFTITPSGITQTLDSNDDNALTSQVRLDAATADLGTYKILAQIVDSASEEHEQVAFLDVIA